MSSKRIVVLGALVATTLLGLVPGPAAAQVIPRLVSYAHPSVTSTACAPATGGLSSTSTIVYGRTGWTRMVIAFAGAQCSTETRLFAVETKGGYSGRTLVPGTTTVAPTPAGLAILQRDCGQYAWTPDVAQALPGACDVIGRL